MTTADVKDCHDTTWDDVLGFVCVQAPGQAPFDDGAAERIRTAATVVAAHLLAHGRADVTPWERRSEAMWAVLTGRVRRSR